MSGIQSNSGSSEHLLGGELQTNQEHVSGQETIPRRSLSGAPVPRLFSVLQQKPEALQTAVNQEHHQDVEQLRAQLAEVRAALEHRDQVDGVRSTLAQQQEAQRKVESGLTGFFSCIIRETITLTAKALITGVVATAMFSVSGPVGAGAAVAGATIALQLGEKTVNKPAQPLQGKQFSEIELLRVIEKVSSEDRRANEELKQLYIDLQPTIEKLASSNNITITGDVHGLIVGDRNTITQTFSSLLQDTSALLDTVRETKAPRFFQDTSASLYTVRETKTPHLSISQERRRTSRRRSLTLFRRPINRGY